MWSKKRNTCRDAGISTPIEIQLQLNVGLVRFAMDCGDAWHFDCLTRGLAARFSAPFRMNVSGHFGARSMVIRTGRPDILLRSRRRMPCIPSFQRARGRVSRNRPAGRAGADTSSRQGRSARSGTQTLHIVHVRLHLRARSRTQPRQPPRRRDLTERAAAERAERKR
jgi:hypothetical protein